MLRTFGRVVTRMRSMAGEFRHQFDEALREADLDDVRKTIGDAQKLNPMNTIRDAVNPLRQMGDEIKADLSKVTSTRRHRSPSISATAAAEARRRRRASAANTAPAGRPVVSAAACPGSAASPLPAAPSSR